MKTKVGTDNPAFKTALKDSKDYFARIYSIQGKHSVDSFHKELGNIMWEYVGMARCEEGLQTAIGKIQSLKKAFWEDVRVTGTQDNLNIELEKANRVADFLELGELMAKDALERKESCGGHFREEYQTEENEAKRDDQNFCHVAAWEWNESSPARHIEELNFKHVPLTQRSYK